MENNQLKIAGFYQIILAGVPVMVTQFHLYSDHLCRQFFIIQTSDQLFTICKRLLAGKLYWAGFVNSGWASITGWEIERLTCVSLLPQPPEDPFDYKGNLPINITSFYIDSINVEKASSPYNEVEAIYYRLHITPEWSPKLAYTRLPLNIHWEWQPVSELTGADFNFMVQMICEYEDGTYITQTKLNEDLIKLLRYAKEKRKLMKE